MEPFGEVSILTEEIENPLRFPGQYFDAETGLHYNYFRDYDPSTGRYIESDPIGLDGGLNTYLYAESNPLLLVDPYGLLSSKKKDLLGGPPPCVDDYGDCSTIASVGILVNCTSGASGLNIIGCKESWQKWAIDCMSGDIPICPRKDACGFVGNDRGSA